MRAVLASSTALILFARMVMTDFIILSLAVWRLSSLLVEEDGPWCVFSRLRHFAGVRVDEDGRAYGLNELGYMLSCIWCTSLLIAFSWFIFWLISPRWSVFTALPFALTGLTVIFHGKGIRYRKRG